MAAQAHYTPAKRVPNLSSARAETNTSDLKRSELDNLLIPDIDWILEHVVVMPAKEFIEENFGSGAWKEDGVIPAKVKEAFKEVDPTAFKDDSSSKKIAEQQLYDPLTKAFDSCCPSLEERTGKIDHHFPSQQLRSLNVHAHTWAVGEEAGLDTKMGPDLFITYDYELTEKPKDEASSSEPVQYPVIPSNKSLFDLPGIIVEVKRDHNADLRIEPAAQTGPAFQHSNTKTKGSKDQKQKHFTLDQKKLISQIFGYVAAGHWSTSQYRFLYCITVTGDILRIWRYSSSGVVVTEGIKYTSHPNAIYSFLQAVGIRDYSAIGPDVGQDQTFQLVNDEEIKEKMRHLIKVYANSSPRLERWAAIAANQPLWRFDCRGERWRNARYGEKRSFIVVPKPIFASAGMFNRTTRCYAAAEEESLKKETLTISDLMIIKLAWQPVSRIHEVYHYKQAITNEGDDGAPGHIDHLSTIVAGGALDDSLQFNGRFIRFTKDSPDDDAFTFVSPLPHIRKTGVDPYISGKLLEKLSHDVPGDWRVNVKELRWTASGQIGTKIHDYKNPKELLRVMIDVIKAHGGLFDRGILHRDISSNNIIINLDASKGEREGLLIDMDMAANLREDRKSTENIISLFEEGLRLGKEKCSEPKANVRTEAEEEEPLSPVHAQSTASENQESTRPARSNKKSSIIDYSSEESDEDAEDKRKGKKRKGKGNSASDGDYSPAGKRKGPKLPPSSAVGPSVVGTVPAKEEAGNGRPPITGTLLFMAAALDYAPIHRAWHDLESLFHVLVFLICRHFREVIYSSGRHNTTMHVTTTTVEERQELLRAIFPSGSLEVRSDAKLKFLKDGRITTPGYDHITSIIREIQLGFGTLYRTLESSYRVCTTFEEVCEFIASTKELNDIVREKLPRWITPLETLFYSISDYKPLDMLINSMKGAKDALDKIFKDLPDAAKNEMNLKRKAFSEALIRLAADVSIARENEFPNHRWMRDLFEDAHRRTQDDNVGPYHFESTRKDRSISKSSQLLATPQDLADSLRESQGTLVSSKSSGAPRTSTLSSRLKRKTEEEDEEHKKPLKRRATQNTAHNK